MQRTGIVPSRPATACGTSRSSWISGISGPTPTIGGRRARPARNRPARKATPGRLTPRSGGGDRVCQRTEPFDLDRDLVAGLHEDLRVAEGADSRGRPGGDQVARLERDRLRDVRDDLGDAEDHV